MTPSGQIRRMTMDDLDGVMHIEESSFPAPWSRYAFEYDLIHNPHANYFIFIQDEMIVGYAGLWSFETIGHIVNMAVLDEYRHKDIAKKLLVHTMEYGRANGVKRFTLEVRASNEPAINLYRSHGFVDVGIRPRYYQDNCEDALIMWTPGREGEVSFS